MKGTLTEVPVSSNGLTPTFSGHETFVLRSTWLKKAYDLLLEDPNLFSHDDAFVLLGVGKNMANSIRYWGRVCGVFERDDTTNQYAPTSIGHALLADNGWDPFLVTSASWWFLHWQIASRLQSASTWYYTFNLLRGGEFTVPHLVEQLLSFAREHEWKVPSEATMTRDVECMIHCYVQSSRQQLATTAEDKLFCPLTELGIIQAVPGLRSYRLKSGPQLGLPDEIVAYAIHESICQRDQRMLAFTDLAYMPQLPGRVFRLDEDSLLDRLQRIRDITNGLASWQDQAGVRQIAWNGDIGGDVARELLARAFEAEVA